MRIKNTTSIPNETIRLILDFVRPPGISNFDVMIKNGKNIAGCAYYKGSSYHSTANPFIVCRIPSDKTKIVHGFLGSIDNPVTWEEKYYPRKLSTYQIAQLKGKRYFLANRVEAAVYLIAHELRHLWQAKTKNKAGYYFGSRGRFSEIDTESYAIHALRQWRKDAKNLS